MVMVGLHDQRTLKCCLTRKTFAFIYWNSIHAKGELIRSALGKKLRKGSRPTRDTSTYSSCDIYSCSRIDRKPTSRRLPFIAFLVNSWSSPLPHWFCQNLVFWYIFCHVCNKGSCNLEGHHLLFIGTWNSSYTLKCRFWVSRIQPK